MYPLQIKYPLGSNGRVSRALNKPDATIHSKKCTRYKVPSRILAGQTPVGSSSLGKVSVKRSATRTPTYTRDTATPTGKSIMARDKITPLSGPPGHSLTDEPGRWPWDRPPVYSNPDDAIDYITDMTSDEPARENI